MAYTVADIKKQMTDVFISNQYIIDAYELAPGNTFEQEFSIASIESILFYCVAYCVWLLYSFFDLFKIEIDTQVTNYTHPTLIWFAEKIKTFQFGDNVINGKDIYNNTGLTDAQIEAKKVIKYAAAIEQEFSNSRFGVRIKVAGEDGSGSRVKLPDAQYNAAKEFLKIFHPGGTYCELTTDEADYLKLSLRVYYNPLVLNNAGQRLDGAVNAPLQDAINAHLKNLPFNGRFNLTAFTDAMQAVDGIEDPRILSAQTKYALTAYVDVTDEVIPEAGYLKIYDLMNDLQIEWIAKSV